MNIQIVSTMRNEARSLPLFLRVLDELRSELCINLQALIVDNGSTDNTPEVIKALPEIPYIMFLENPVGSAYAEGLEKAISMVSTPYVFIVPSDLQFDKVDLIEMLRTFLDYSKESKYKDREVALFSFRRFRTDGGYQKLRGKIWRFIVTRALGIDSRLDPASQLKIIPTPLVFNSINKNFIWDIEVLIWAINRVVDYRIVEVGFKRRIFGESSISNNPLKAVSIALLGLVRLSHKLKDSNSRGNSHFIR